MSTNNRLELTTRVNWRRVKPELQLLLAVVLFVIFGSIAISDRLRGGYQPEKLSDKEFTASELASDF